MWRVIQDKRVWFAVAAVALCVLVYKTVPDLLYLLVPATGLSAAAKTRKARATRDAAVLDRTVADNEAVVIQVDPTTVQVAVKQVREDALDGDYWTPLELD